MNQTPLKYSKQQRTRKKMGPPLVLRRLLPKLQSSQRKSHKKIGRTLCSIRRKTRRPQYLWRKRVSVFRHTSAAKLKTWMSPQWKKYHEVNMVPVWCYEQVRGHLIIVCPNKYVIFFLLLTVQQLLERSRLFGGTSDAGYVRQCMFTRSLLTRFDR